MAHGAAKDAVAERVRDVAVCYSAEAYDLGAVCASAGLAAHAAHSSTGQAELVGSLGGTCGAGGAGGTAGPSFFHLALGGAHVTHSVGKDAVVERARYVLAIRTRWW